MTSKRLFINMMKSKTHFLITLLKIVTCMIFETMSLQGKKIVLGITGSIAAYKTPHLVRLLIKAGAEVKVVTTKAANSFVSQLSLATVSKQSVLTDNQNGNEWNNHVALGLWADVILIAPCSANTLAKFANGLCDNLLCAVYLSARCRVLIAPAMDEDMWKNAVTRHNLKKVIEFGNEIIPVATGELASGLIGEGRMAETESIITYLNDFFSKNKEIVKGIKALVTAGPTYEKIDPVRFIGNFSSGKMGIAIAEELARRGAQVTLVLGPSHEPVSDTRINVIHVESAEQMYYACINEFPKANITVMAAAVADYKPIQMADNKIKKSEGTWELALTKTEDILFNLGKIKQPWQTLAGFALETNNELENAQKKMQNKNADMIVLNSLQDVGAGFGHATNKVTILTNNNSISSLPLLSKKEVAEEIVNQIIGIHNEKKILS